MLIFFDDMNEIIKKEREKEKEGSESEKETKR